MAIIWSRDIYRKNQVDHVAQHFTHEIKRIEQLVELDFDQLKGLVSDNELSLSMNG